MKMSKWKIFLQYVLAGFRFFIGPAACLAMGVTCWELCVDITTTTGFLVLLKFLGVLLLLAFLLFMLQCGISFYFDAFVLNKYIKSSEEAKLSVINFCKQNNIHTFPYNAVDVEKSEVK